MTYLDIMQYEYNFEELGIPEYCLGYEIEIGKDGNMTWSAETYIKNVTDRIEKRQGIKLTVMVQPSG